MFIILPISVVVLETEVKNVDEEDRKMIINLYEAKVG